jgi:hypothetical protein
MERHAEKHCVRYVMFNSMLLARYDFYPLVFIAASPENDKKSSEPSCIEIQSDGVIAKLGFLIC